MRKKTKTYNSGDSLVVTHLTTNPPVSCLYMAERTGSLVFKILWSYVLVIPYYEKYSVSFARFLALFWFSLNALQRIG